MKDTVAIIGNARDPRDRFDFDRTDCDIWVFNEARSSERNEWCKRADGIFQLHKPMIWRTTANWNDTNHYKWLQEQTEAVIFMQDKYEDVPKSEKYPLMEIIEKYPTAYQYFTSSVAYSIALAIYKGYKFIELWGIEMATNTEYGHQRLGVAYWIGFAAGLGIYVKHVTKKFWAAPLYAYEGDVQIPIEYYEERMKNLEVHRKGTQQAYNNVRAMIDELLDKFIQSYKTDMSEIGTYIQALGQNSHNFGMVDGAYQVNERYYNMCKTMIEETGTYLIVRQQLEGQKIAAQKELPKEQHVLTRIGDIELPALRKRLNTNDNKSIREGIVKDLKTGLLAFAKAATDYGRTNGIAVENNSIIGKFDEMLRNQGINAEQAEAIAQEAVRV